MKNFLPVNDLTSHTRPRSERLAVVTLAEIKATTQHLSSPHRHDFHAFQFFTAGTGHHQIDAQTLPIEAGALFYVSPSQVHAWQTNAPPEGYSLMFTAAFWLEAARRFARREPDRDFSQTRSLPAGVDRRRFPKNQGHF